MLKVVLCPVSTMSTRKKLLEGIFLPLCGNSAFILKVKVKQKKVSSFSNFFRQVPKSKQQYCDIQLVQMTHILKN